MNAPAQTPGTETAAATPDTERPDPNTTVTLDHIRQAAEWAIAARDAVGPVPIDGLVRRYEQCEWDCGTSCCMWGAASILSGCGPADSGPGDQWTKDLVHKAVAGILRSGTSKPEQILALLRGALLRGADLCGADLCGADLCGADLCDANLCDANLCGANLCGANLCGANLCDANLCGANLCDANLCDANLCGANLCGANLCDANLCGANLCGANLCDANLSGALVAVGNVVRRIERT